MTRDGTESRTRTRRSAQAAAPGVSFVWDADARVSALADVAYTVAANTAVTAANEAVGSTAAVADHTICCGINANNRLEKNAAVRSLNSAIARK